MFHVDNANFSEDTFDGRNVTDALMIAGFQTSNDTMDEDSTQSFRIDQSCRSQPLSSHNVDNLIFCQSPNEKSFVCPSVTSFLPEPSEENKENVLECKQKMMSWLLCKHVALQKEVEGSQIQVSVATEIPIVLKEEREQDAIIPVIDVTDCHSLYNPPKTTEDKQAKLD